MNLIRALQCTALSLLVTQVGLASDADLEGRTYQFRLTTGTGVAVCDAYLKRLRATRFEHPPYCDIPEEAAIEGFRELKREPLMLDDVERLWPHVVWFNLIQKQSTKEEEPATGAAWPTTIARQYYGDSLFVWKYQTPISLDNSGAKQEIIIWRGPGASFDGFGIHCGDLAHAGPDNKDYPWFDRRLGYVLTPGDASIDERETKRLFGNPAPLANKSNTLNPYQPLGDSQGIFAYRGLYYLYAFTRLERQETTAHGKDHLRVTGNLSVYLRDKKSLHQLCAYLPRVNQDENSASIRMRDLLSR